MLGERLDTIFLVAFAHLFLPSYNVSLLSEIYFYLRFLALSKSKRDSNQGIYNRGLKLKVTTKDIKIGYRA